MVKYSLIFTIFILIGGVAKAQSTRESNNAPPVPLPRYQAEKITKKKSVFKRWFKRNEQDEVAAFRKKMKKLYRKKRREEKLAEDPQYSDPLYFGHKKPPKKRPLGKRKYCEECGIVH